MAPADPPAASAEEPAVSILAPSSDVEAVRQRRERPSEVGRYLLILMGAVCASASSAALLTRAATGLPTLALLPFGVLLVVLGLVQHLVLRRDRAYWPDAAHVWQEGVELVLHNGEVRGALWDDPKLALDIYVTPRRGAEQPDRLLVWLMDAKVPPCDLSADGFARVKAAVLAHRLAFAEVRRGRKGHERSVFSIRPSYAVSDYDRPQKVTETAAR